MRKNSELKDWIRTVTTQMPQLSKPQAVVLAMWSFGMVMVNSCGLTTVSVFLAQFLGKKENSVRQQLRESYWDSKDKKGKKRAELDVTTCFGPLMRWILQGWSPEEKRLALAADASTLGTRFTVLVISVVYRGCGIPVAWKVVEATTKGAWKPHWQNLLTALKDSVPTDWFVVVTTDRGLYADWLYQQIQSQRWHPFMRINDQGQFRLPSEQQFRPLNTLVTEVGKSWSGRVRCFKTNPLDCTLLARWDEGYAEPWLIVTDLEPELADACWYGMRSWVECLFKDSKRGGWQWHHTKITSPKRAERHWLARALATLWVVSVGGEADATLPASSFDDLPSTHIARRRSTNSKSPRLLSCFRRGFLVILSALLNHLPLPMGSFVPNSWPCSIDFSTSYPPILSSA